MTRGGAGADAPTPDDDGGGGGLLLAVALTALAGFVDAVAFVRFNGLFVSFMSGNTTRLGALPSEGRVGEAAMALGAVALFVMGAFAGRLLDGTGPATRRPVHLACVSALLVVAALSIGWSATGPVAGFGLAAMALAMGIQNSVLHRADGARATPTYVTGTLVALGHGLADAACGVRAPWGAYLAMWFGLAAGAALGALAIGRLGPHALLAPAAFAALLALGGGALVRRRPGPGSTA